MSPRWQVGGATHPGHERDRNEDAFAVDAFDADRHALIVCDGMGGHADGDVASHTAVTALRAALPAALTAPPYQALHAALRQADDAVAVAAGSSGMGTTAVVAWLDGPGLWYGWVGDSRLYLIRDGKIIERSLDHTRVQALVDQGELTPTEAAARDDAHVLTQALGTGTAQPSVYAEPVVAQPGDRLLLCSDGLHALVGDHELPALLHDGTPDEVARRLIDLANARGGHDNVTVIVAAYGVALGVTHGVGLPRTTRAEPAEMREAVALPATAPAPSPTGPTVAPSRGWIALVILLTFALGYAVGHTVGASRAVPEVTAP